MCQEMLSLLFLLPLCTAFIPSTQIITRRSIVDLKDFRNSTHDSISGITFVTPRSVQIDHKLPTVVMLPGLEFSSLSLAQYAPGLIRDYNLVYACSSNDDNDVEFSVMSDSIVRYLKNRQEIIFVGESFGALLALDASAKISKRRCRGVVLLNSATAYPRSRIPAMIERARGYDDARYMIAMLQFLGTQTQNVAVVPEKALLFYFMLCNMLVLRKEVLMWRIEHWLEQGCKVDMYNYPHKIVAVAGERDTIFDSVQEAERICTISKRCVCVRVPDSSHMIVSENFALKELLQREFS